MNRRVQRSLAAVGAFLPLLLRLQAGAQDQKEWTWKDGEGRTRTRAELEQILAEHKLWLESRQSRGTQVDLSGADLRDADLIGAQLSGADLGGADLIGAQLSGADMRDADLIGAWLSGADLSSTNLVDADLGGAHLNDADLSGAHLNDAHLGGALLADADLSRSYLTGADLSDAILTGADLSVADLSSADLNRAQLAGVELKDAYFSHADLQGTIFEPKSSPEIRGIARAEGLDFVTYHDNPDALVQLRKQFQENGFRAQERKITYALSRRKAQLDGPVERWFQWFAFDLTCQYGMSPGRSLKIWLGLLLLCLLVYVGFIHRSGESGIYRIQKTGGPTAKEEVEEQIRPPKISSNTRWPYPFRLIQKELRVLFWAGFFSLMSAFNIGFRDMNFGRWLRLLPRTEYDLKAKGWARTVAGFQSLISVYLIALWVLTYFGRPFE